MTLLRLIASADPGAWLVAALAVFVLVGGEIWMPWVVDISEWMK